MEGRVPPHDIEAEQAVLGSMLVDKDAVIAGLEVLKEDDFYREDNKAVFEAIASLYSKSEPIDLITVKKELTENGNFERIGGMEFIVSLPGKVPTTTNVDRYIKIVKEQSMRRKLIQTSNELISLGYDDTEDYKAVFEGLELGTEATRTGIIDNARKSNYISLKKDVYNILPNGEFLIESLIQMGISMDKYKTSEMGQALKKVYHETMTIDDAVNLACNEISEVFKEKKDIPIEKDIDTGFFGDIVGKCPKCGEDVIKTRYNYGCRNYKECDFKIASSICGRVISKKNVEKLLETGKTSKIEGFISKNNKEFNAYLKLDKDKVVFDFND